MEVVTGEFVLGKVGGLIAPGTGSAYNPTGQNIGMILPVVGLKNVFHIEVRVAGDRIDVLLRIFSPLHEVEVGATSARCALHARTLLIAVHAVTAGQAVGQSAVHADNNRLDRCVIL